MHPPMAPNLVITLGSAAILVSMLFVGASAQTSSCTNAIVSLSPCLDFITGNSSTPSSSCCKQLSTVVQSEPQCLCAVINGGASSFGININKTQALALPVACNVKTPPLSNCKDTNGPTGSPSGSPSGGGSTSPPAGSSDGSGVQVPVFIMISLLLAMAYLSISPTCF